MHFINPVVFVNEQCIACAKSPKTPKSLQHRFHHLEVIWIYFDVKSHKATRMIRLPWSFVLPSHLVCIFHGVPICRKLKTTWSLTRYNLFAFLILQLSYPWAAASHPVPNTIRRPRGHSGNCGIFLYFQGPTPRSNPWWIPSRCFGSSSPKTPKIRVAGWNSISAKWPPTASWTFELAHIFDLPLLDAIFRLYGIDWFLLEHWKKVGRLKLALVRMDIQS